jgi:hypothetical protein
MTFTRKPKSVVKVRWFKNELRVHTVFDGGGKCFWCKCRVKLVKGYRGVLPDDAATIDHLYERGGTGKRESDEVVLACRKCNHERGEVHNRMLMERRNGQCCNYKEPQVNESQ